MDLADIIGLPPNLAAAAPQIQSAQQRDQDLLNTLHDGPEPNFDGNETLQSSIVAPAGFQPVAPLAPTAPYSPLPPPSARVLAQQPDYEDPNKPGLMSSIYDTVKNAANGALDDPKGAAKKIAGNRSVQQFVASNLPPGLSQIAAIAPDALRASKGVLAPYFSKPPEPAKPDDEKKDTGNDLLRSLFAPPKVTNVAASETALVDPKRQAALAAADDAEKGGISKEGDAYKNVAGDEANTELAKADALRGEGRALGDMSGAEQNDADARARELDNQRTRIQKMSALIAQDKEDPDRYMDSRTTGQKVGLTLAAALGAGAQGMLGLKRNQAMDQIDEHINQDIAAQRSDFEKKKGRLGDMKSLYGEAYKATGDQNDAHRVARQLAYENVKRQGEAMVAQSNSQSIRDKWQPIAAQLDQKIAQTDQKSVKEQIGMNHYNPAHQVVTGGGPGIDWKQQHQIAEDFEKARVPAAEGAFGALQKHVTDGPELGYGDRLLLKSGSGADSPLLSPQARQIASNAHSLAIALAGEEGSKNADTVEHLYKGILQTGSKQDIQNGLGGARAIIDSRRSNFAASHDPMQLALHEALRATAPRSTALRHDGGKTPSQAPPSQK